MRVEMVAARPGPRVDKWGAEMDQWSVELEYDGRSFETNYFMGSGHAGRAPETNEVLSSLRTDCYAGELTFEDFCSDYGYDEDSRSAYGTWEDCAAMRRRIAAWLGADFEMFACSDEDEWTTDDEGDVEIAAA